MKNIDLRFIEKYYGSIDNADFSVLSDFADSVACDTKVYTVFPGFCDVHVHFRQPGFSYKETVFSGCLSAAHGGYTSVCTMPNLRPVPDCPSGMKAQTDIIRRDALIRVYPYAAITKGQQGRELSDMAALAQDAVAFSDDGRGVQSEQMMLQAMTQAKKLGKVIAAHCEDDSLLFGGYIHDGDYAASHGHRGICSESEWRQVERDLRLAEETGCRYHVCHISCAETVQLIREAKKRGVDVTCETAPHYLTLDDSDLREEGRFKMNPPLRSREDRQALIDGVLDGTIDMIATDHAPHGASEKKRGLAGSLFGIVGLETAFSVLYTRLIREGIIEMEKIIDMLTVNPENRFGIDKRSGWSVWSLEDSYSVDPATFLSMGKATPYEGNALYARCLLTVCNGKTVYAASR